MVPELVITAFQRTTLPWQWLGQSLAKPALHPLLTINFFRIRSADWPIVSPGSGKKQDHWLMTQVRDAVIEYMATGVAQGGVTLGEGSVHARSRNDVGDTVRNT